MPLVKAIRKSVWIKMLLGGSSNSGKTFSALRVAKGIAEECGGSGVAMINTEASRGVYYADQFDYEIDDIEAPYTVQKYIAAIDECIAAGYKVIIIDSISQEWTWLNEYHDSLGGNSFQAWSRCKPIHKKFMDKILTCPAHIICTARGKQEYSIEEKNGRKEITKLGVGIEQSKQLSFEYTVSLMLNENHFWTVDKDNSGVFEGNPSAILTEADGKKLYAWANVGGKAPEKMTSTMAPDSSVDQLAELKKEIIQKCIDLGGQKNPDVLALTRDKSYGNPNSIRDLDSANKYLAALSKIKPAK